MANNHQFAGPVLHVRNLLHRHGFRYCDGNDDVVRQQRQLHQAREDAARRALDRAEPDATNPLPLTAISATTTDLPLQELEQTLNPDADTFWSSTGANTTDADDDLVFACQECALARIAAVQLGVYRAQFQQGRVPVAVTEEAQTFVLPAHAPPGRYLRITLHGRQQMQLEDGRYYVAIRSVEAFGKPLDCLRVRDAARIAAPAHCIPPAKYQDGAVPELLVLDGNTYTTPGGQRPSVVGGLFSLLGMR